MRDSGRIEWFGAPAARDCLFLAVAVVLSFAWYAPRLGFYSDDWAFLARYATASDQTVRGFFTASISAQHAMRPVQVWLCAALYRLFGMEPLGYHLFNGLLLVGIPVLLYGIFRQLRVARTISLAVALVYAMLPSYSTDRYWYVAFAITLSMTACLASIYADLKAASAPVRHGTGWKAVAAAALLISALAYEVALPLFFLVPFLMVARLWQEHGTVPRERLPYIAALIIINVALLAGVAGFKLRTTVRLGAQEGLTAQIADIVRDAVQPNAPYGHYGLNVFSAIRVHFGESGLKLPLAAASLSRTAPAGVLWLTAAFGLFAFGYLRRAFHADRWPSALEWAALTAAGLVVFGLGYAIFLTNYNVQFTATGIANRSAIAAALGAAMCIVGCLGWVVTWLASARWISYVFAALVTAVATCSFLIVNTVAERWVVAYSVERNVLAGIQQRFQTLPSHSTLILDGVCPYVGPAIVFESNWDLAGALQTIYRDGTLSADVVTPRLVVGGDGLTTTIYQQAKTYPYGSSLIVYDGRTGRAQPLPDAATAAAYFGKSNSSRLCPPAQEGVGVRLF